MAETRSGALEGERMLSQMFPEYQGSYTTKWADYKTWQSSAASPNVVWNETYFDLSGYELDDLTLFPLGVTLQDPGIYSGSTLGGPPLASPMEVLDVVSQDRLDPGEVFTDMALNNAPGMMESNEDWIQVVWGQYRLMLPQASFREMAQCSCLPQVLFMAQAHPLPWRSSGVIDSSSSTVHPLKVMQ